MKVWAGCLAAYNGGTLHGKWIDLRDKDEQALQRAIDAILRTSPDPNIRRQLYRCRCGEEFARDEEAVVVCPACGATSGLTMVGTPYPTSEEWFFPDYEFLRLQGHARLHEYDPVDRVIKLARLDELFETERWPGSLYDPEFEGAEPDIIRERVRKRPRKRTAADAAAIIERAQEAFRAAALAQWKRDGKRDIGACGGAMLVLDGRSSVARQLLRSGLGLRVEGGVSPSFVLPEEIRSQHAAIKEAAMRAARDVFEAAGVRIAQFSTYVD
jgi:antirestriction protein